MKVSDQWQIRWIKWWFPGRAMIVWESHPGPWESLAVGQYYSQSSPGCRRPEPVYKWRLRFESKKPGKQHEPARPGPPPVVGKKKAAEKIWILASTTEILSCTFCYEIGGHYSASVFHQIAILLVCLESVTHIMITFELLGFIYLLLRKPLAAPFPAPSLEVGAEIVTVTQRWDFTTSPENRSQELIVSTASGSYETSKL